MSGLVTLTAVLLFPALYAAQLVRIAREEYDRREREDGARRGARRWLVRLPRRRVLEPDEVLPPG